MIHVFGDSHTGMFRDDPRFQVHYIGPATAWGYGNANSKTQSIVKLRELAKTLEPKDQLWICAGEIDCRWLLFEKAGGDYSKALHLIDVTIARLTKNVFKMRVNRKIRFVSIPPAGFPNNDFGSKYFMNDHQRGIFNLVFNTRLALHIGRKKIVDVHSDTGDSCEGIWHMLPEYAADPYRVHLNKKALKFVESYI